MLDCIQEKNNDCKQKTGILHVLLSNILKV